VNSGISAKDTADFSLSAETYRSKWLSIFFSISSLLWSYGSELSYADQPPCGNVPLPLSKQSQVLQWAVLGILDTSSAGGSAFKLCISAGAAIKHEFFKRQMQTGLTRTKWHVLSWLLVGLNKPLIGLLICHWNWDILATQKPQALVRAESSDRTHEVKMHEPVRKMQQREPGRQGGLITKNKKWMNNWENRMKRSLYFPLILNMKHQWK